MTTTADILRAARALIDTPAKWTKNANAKNKQGVAVDALARGVACLCVNGALVRATGGYGGDDLDRAYGAFAAAIGLPPYCVVSWNDGTARKHEHIMAAFDKAIALAERAP